MDARTLTVIVPTIGRESLGRAVHSVARQSVPTECVVEADFGRTGCGPTLNRAVGRVSTPWVATMGDDDALDPLYAQTLAEQPLDDLDLVVFQMRYPDGTVLPTVSDPEALRHGGVGCSYALRTRLAHTVGWIGEPSRPYFNEDWEMLSAVRELGGRIAVVPRVMYYVRHAPW